MDSKTLAKVFGVGALIGILAAGIALLYTRSCHREQPTVPTDATPQPAVVTTSVATASTAVAQTVVVRIIKPKRVAEGRSACKSPAVQEESPEEVVVEVTQQATASAVAAATTSVSQNHEEPQARMADSRSDLTDPSRWGIGAGLVAGTVFVDYQLIRQRVFNQELSLDIQGNHMQVGAGLAITLVGPVFLEAGLSAPYASVTQPVPYLGAGARLRF